MRRFTVSSLTAICIVFSSGATQSSIVNASETTATENFDKNTMTKISDCIRKFRIQQTPRKYNVYMITGGLNTPNPDILYCDDRGGITFAPVPRHEPMYRFQQTSVSPATWMVRGGMVAHGSTSQTGFKSVPWVKKKTETGQTYYEWDRNNFMSEYYFQKGDTFVELNISSMDNRHYPFPERVMRHLIPLGNPVTK